MKQIKLNIYLLAATVDKDLLEEFPAQEFKIGNTIFVSNLKYNDYTKDIKEAVLFFSKQEAQKVLEDNMFDKTGKVVYNKDYILTLECVVKGKKK